MCGDSEKHGPVAGREASSDRGAAASARPARSWTGDRLVVATHNPGKLREFRTLLGPLGIEVVSAGDLGLAEPAEEGADFAANARIKARAAAAAAGLPALADDSGLVVDGLGGRPGVHSARWAKECGSFEAAMRRLHDELAARFAAFDVADRRARFVCTVALCWPDGHCETFEGRVEGEIIWPPRGAGGFGYDPVFVPAGASGTFAEMPAAEKHAQSHRGRALRALVDACFRAG